MSHQLAFIGLIVLTLLWRQLAPVTLRRVAVPWAFAIFLMNISCAAFYFGPIRAVYVLMNYSTFVIMLDGFDLDRKRNNPAWTAFLLFWIYMILSSFYGYYVFSALFYWTNILLTSFCCGYFTARWVLRNENGLHKLLFAMATVSCIAMFLYAQHGNFAAIEAGAVGRVGLDMETLGEDVKSNVNYTALCMLMFIPFLVVSVLRTVRTKSGTIVKWMSIVAFFLCGVTLVRTGARNGAVGLLPSLWYFLFSTTNRVKRRRRIGLFITITILFIPFVFVMMKGAESIRFLDIKGVDSNMSYGTLGDDITTGRMTLWKSHIEYRSITQIVFGGGMLEEALVDDVVGQRAGRITAGNAHSVFMTVLYNSGLVGLLLLANFLSVSVKRGLRMGDRGRLGLLFIGTWIFSGVAESWGMQGGGTALLGGFGIGLLSHKLAENSEFGERDVYLPVWGGR